jgi:hypothetical protein
MIWALFWSKVFISRTAMTTYHEQGYVKNQIENDKENNLVGYTT